MPGNSDIGSPPLADAQLSQALFVDAQVMADLVKQSLLSLLDHLLFGPAVQLVSPLVDDDAVRQHHGVTLCALGQADAGVHAEQRGAVMKAGLSQLVDCGPPADLNIDVVKGVAKLGRKLFQRPLDDALEFASFHLSTLYQRDNWDTRDTQGKRRSGTNRKGYSWNGARRR